MPEMSVGRNWALFLQALFWLLGRHVVGLVLMSSGMSGVLVLRLAFLELVSGRTARLL